MSNNVIQNYYNQVCELKLANSKIKNQYDELIKNLKIFFDPAYNAAEHDPHNYSDSDYEHDKAEYFIESLIGIKLSK